MVPLTFNSKLIYSMKRRTKHSHTHRECIHIARESITKFLLHINIKAHSHPQRKRDREREGETDSIFESKNQTNTIKTHSESNAYKFSQHFKCYKCTH